MSVAEEIDMSLNENTRGKLSDEEDHSMHTLTDKLYSSPRSRSTYPSSIASVRDPRSMPLKLQIPHRD